MIKARHAGPLRGRDDVLMRIGELLAAGAAGRGGVLVIDGPPGSGRTRILSEAAAMADRNAFTVAVVRGESDLDELRASVERCRPGRPVLVALDDAERADALTLAAVRTLSATAHSQPIVWAVAGATACAPADAFAVLQDLVRRGAEYLGLGALDAEATRQLVGDVLGEAPPPELLDLAARAEGSPWLITTFFEGLIEDGLARGAGAEVLSTVVPTRLRRAARDRLNRFDPATARLLQVAAILGRFAPEHVATMLEMSPATLLTPLQEALAAGILVEVGDGLAFREELFRAGVVSTLPEAARRGLRRQAAEVLLAGGGAAPAIAEHLVASAHRGDGQAIRALREAARQLGAADPIRAADLSSHALRLTPRDDPAWGALAAESVLLLQAALQDDEADAVGAMALGGTLDPADEADVRLSLAALCRRTSASRIDHSRHALLTDGLPTVLRARHLAMLAQNLTAAGHLAEAARFLPQAREAADGADDELALATVRLAEAELAEAQGHYERACTAGDDGPRRSGLVAVKAALGATSMAKARAIAATGRIDDALRLVDAAVIGAQLDGHRWLQALCQSVRCRLLIDAGRPLEAIGEAEEVLDLCAPGGGPSDFGVAIIAGEAALHAGDPVRLKAALAAARERHGNGDPAARDEAARLLALASWADGRADEGFSWLTRGGIDDAIAQLAPADCPALIRMALATGRESSAIAAACRAEAVTEHNPSSAVLVAVLAHCHGLLARDPEVLERAARGFRATGHPLRQAAALDDAALALAQAGRREDATRCAHEAAQVMNDCGSLADLRRMRRRLRAAGLDYRGATVCRPKEGWNSLTGAELDVVRLVADGGTNRQVAQRLVLSPHTVSTHLRHAFVKLQINSRVELTRIVVEQDLEDATAA